MVAAFITLVIILLTIVITLVNTYNYARAARQGPATFQAVGLRAPRPFRPRA